MFLRFGASGRALGSREAVDGPAADVENRTEAEGRTDGTAVEVEGRLLNAEGRKIVARELDGAMALVISVRSPELGATVPDLGVIVVELAMTVVELVDGVDELDTAGAGCSERAPDEPPRLAFDGGPFALDKGPAALNVELSFLRDEVPASDD